MIKYNCYLCGKKVETNDLIATISTHIEIYDKECNEVVTTLLDEKICSWCAHRFDYWQRKIQEIAEKEKQNKSKEDKNK